MTGDFSLGGPSLLSKETSIRQSPGNTTIKVAARAPRKEITTSMPVVRKHDRQIEWVTSGSRLFDVPPPSS